MNALRFLTSIRSRTILPFVLLIVLATGLVGFLSFQNSQKAIEEMSSQLIGETQNRVRQNLDDVMRIPHLVDKQNGDALSQGIVSFENPRELMHFFYQQSKNYNSSGLSIGTTQIGTASGTLYGGNGAEGYVVVADATTGNAIRRYQVDENGYATDKVLREVADYDPRTRSWYKAGVAAQGPTWNINTSVTDPSRVDADAVIPFYDSDGTLQGVLTTSISLVQLSDYLQGIKVGQNGQVFIFDRQGLMIASSVKEDANVPLSENAKELGRLPINESTIPVIKQVALFMESSLPYQGITSAQDFTFEIDRNAYMAQVSSYKTETGIDWLVVVAVPKNDFLGTIQAGNNVTVLAIVLAALLAVVITFFIAQSIVNPISELVKVAESVTSGNLNVIAPVKSTDEIGKLAATFNTMTNQLRDMIGGLERRVTERTKALTISSEISRRLSSILDKGNLVAEVVNQIQASYNYYHVHIYLMDERNDKLVMAGGTGEAGKILLERKHSISRGKGLVGRAAESGEPIVVSDTGKDRDWLPNPLLPETKSEISVPIVTGDREVLGVLDVQNDAVNSLTEQDAEIISTIASQVAVALQNIESYERADQSIKDLNSQRYALDQHSIVAITDVTGKITYANDKFVEISKYSREELIGQDHRILNSGYHPKEFMRNLWVTIANGKVFHAEIRNKAKDGSLYWVDTTIVPFLNAEGKPYQYVAIRTDITQRKKDEETLAKRTFELEAITNINEKIQSTTTIEAALQVAARELGHVFGKKPAVVTLDVDALKVAESDAKIMTEDK